MDLQSLTNVPGARSSRKRLGRGTGSGLGKTSGRGHKGQQARKGHKHKLGFEGGQMPFLRRLPKRGFKNPAATVDSPVNVAALAAFDEGAVVDRDALVTLGLADGALDGVKILGNGEIAKKLTVKAQAFSASAKAKIEAAGGTCEIA